MGFLKALDGYKTYLQLTVMGVLAMLEMWKGITFPPMVYMLLGIGAGTTAKMKIDATYAAMKVKK